MKDINTFIGRIVAWKLCNGDVNTENTQTKAEMYNYLFKCSVYTLKLDFFQFCIIMLYMNSSMRYYSIFTQASYVSYPSEPVP